MLNAQVNHGNLTMLRLDLLIELPAKVGSISRIAMEHGDHLLLTTSGITTTVLKLSVKT